MITETLSIAGLRSIAVRHSVPKLNVIILHGYSMSPEDLAPFAHAIKTSADFFLPCAPFKATPQGYSWWPVDPVARAKRDGRDLANIYPEERGASRQLLVSYCQSVRELNAALPLLVCGFSQGGMLTCDAILCDGLEVDGLALLSASRIAFDEWQPKGARLRNRPILVSHGVHDRIVPFAAGEALRDFVIQCGARVTWIPFDGEHQVPLQVWRALRSFCDKLGDSHV